MSFTPLEYGRVWTSAADFPTFESNETVVRQDLQYHPDAIKNFINTLLESLASPAAAANLGAVSLDGNEEPITIQSALMWLREAMDDIVSGVVPDGSVSTDKILNGAVTPNKLADGAVITEKIATNAVTPEKIANAAVQTAKLADDAVTADKIATDAVTADAIKAGSVGTSELADASVTALKIAADSVGTNKVKSKAITTDKIALLAITAALLADGAVATSKIADLAVTTAKLADATVTLAKLGSDVTPAALGCAVPSVARTVTLLAGEWANKTQTVAVTGVSADSNISVSATPADYVAYGEAQIRATAQADGTITFMCEEVPEADVSAAVMIVG